MTPQLSQKNLLLSNNNITATINDNVIFLQANNIGQSDFSLVNNLQSKIAFELIQVNDKIVSILNLEVSCIHTLHINQSSNANDISFQRMIVFSEKSKTPKDTCLLQIRLVFSDGTKADLLDYKHTKFYLELVHSDGSVVVRDLENYLYEPFKYENPGNFVLHLFEAEQCEKNRLIFKKTVDIFGKEKNNDLVVTTPAVIVKPSTKPSTTSTTTQTSTAKDKKEDATSVGGINTNTLFLTMKILIGLVVLVALIVILNCIIKLRNRKSASLLDRQLNSCQIYGQMDKLTASTYSPVDITSQNSNNPHPPLLPPPGPLYNSSNSSQLDLAVNATPDIFWGLPQPGDKIDRAMAPSHLMLGMKMNTLNGQCNPMGFHNIFPSNRKTSPSPQSDNIEYNYSNNSNGTRSSNPRTKQSSQNGYHYPPSSLHDSDSLASGSGSKTSSQIAVMVPPCPPLRWNNNWGNNQFPVYFPHEKELNMEPSVSRLSTEHSSQSSLTPSHSSSWEIKQNLVLPPIGFNSIDNVCEKSSGLGSLTSTQPGSDCSKKESGLVDSPKTANYATSH